MRIAVAKFVTLYLALVLTSGLIICIALDTHPLAALATASVGCLFKTLAAWGHGLLWSKWQEPAAYDVELVALPLCQDRLAA